MDFQSDFHRMLKNVVSESYGQMIDEIMATQPITTNAEALLALCQVITNKIDIYVRQQYIRQAQRTITLYRSRNQLDEKEEAEIMVYATQLIYQLRSFITGEEITFYLAAKSQDGTYQSSAFFSQEEILRSLSQTRRSAIGVSMALQKELINKNNDTFMKKHRKNMWQQVEYLAEPSPITEDAHKIDIRKSKSKSPHWAYQSQKKDTNVYVSQHGKTRLKYYDTLGKGRKEHLQLFNNGWLWEWYNSILYGEDDMVYAIVSQDIQKGSIKFIIRQQDYIAGTKQGDFRDYLGRQIQSKYGNNKIISYNNIRNIIYSLQNALVLYIQEGKNASKLLSVIQEHFLPESVEIGSKYYNDVTKNMLMKLDKKIDIVKNF